MVGWHHRLSGHGFEQALGGGEGQGGLVCCSPWGHKGSDTTEPPNNNKSRMLCCQFHLVVFSHSNRCAVVSHCSLNLYFSKS